MDNKLEFTLVPIAGSVGAKGGYRSKFGKQHNTVVDFDDVVREARKECGYFGVSDEMVKLIVRGVLQTMIDKTAEDGKTRRIDDYLSVSLKVRGKFDSEDEDFDPEKHELALSLKQLSAFRPEFSLQPVNKNRKRQFRIYSIRDAEHKRKNKQVIWGKDFIIKGDSLLQKDGTCSVGCLMKGPDGVYHSVEPEVVSFSDTEVRCHWPEEFADDYYKRGYFWAWLDKPRDINVTDPNAILPDREKTAVVYPD